MKLNEAYYLGGAEKAYVGTEKVWAIYDDYCYVDQSAYVAGGGSYGNNIAYINLPTTPTAVYRIMFRPLGASLSNAGTLFGQYQDSANDLRLTYSSRHLRLVINGVATNGSNYTESDWLNNDRYLEFGNYYVKDLATGNYLITGATQTGITSLQKRLNLGYTRIYQAEVWDQGNCLFYGVPVRWSDGVFGIWDEIGYRFYPATYPERISGYTCEEGVPNWNDTGSTPDTGGTQPTGWYLVPHTDAETDPLTNQDYVFFCAQDNATLTSGLSIVTGMTVTALTNGEYKIDDSQLNTYGKFRWVAGTGFKLKGGSSTDYLCAGSPQNPSTAYSTSVFLGSNQPTYLNQAGLNVYINFVNDGYCWALNYKYFQFGNDPTSPWNYYGTIASKCSGPYTSEDYRNHLYLYKLVQR